jgi:hypothetical protein
MTITIDGIYREGPRGLVVGRLTRGLIRFIFIFVTFPFPAISYIIISGSVIN